MSLLRNSFSKTLLTHYLKLRSLVYFGESLPLAAAQRTALGRWGDSDRPPKEFQKAVLEELEALFKKDADLLDDPRVPLRFWQPQGPRSHLKSLARVWLDGIKVTSRMLHREHREIAVQPGSDPSLPDYYLRNFHYQTDGYLSRQSAELYDHQVEILFKGAASAMRRLLLPPLLERIPEQGQNLKILEIAAGRGSATKWVAPVFSHARITAVDLSADYLKVAQETLKDHTNIDFVQANAARLPFKDGLYDVVYSVFLFHELPAEERLKVIRETSRVLRPGGLWLFVDSLQLNDNSRLNWGLKRFPIDFHEPFYAHYLKHPLEEDMKQAGLEAAYRDLGLFSKCLMAVKPQAQS